MRLQSTVPFQAFSYGTSAMGLPLEYFRDSDQTERKLDLLVMAGVHGEEAEGIFVLSRALRECASMRNCAVILCANPDGVLRATRGNSNGVDLNRNFPTKNWSGNPVMVRPFADGPRDLALSPGSAPASEPETCHLLSLLETLDVDNIVSIHAPLACVDAPAENTLADHLAQRSGLRRVIDIGYETPGSFGTWCAENNKNIVTFELPKKSGEDLVRKYSPLFRELIEKGI